jgi:endoribonuclease LACTB2
VNIVNVGYDSTNYYVLAQKDVRLLVDVGMPGTLPKLIANLKRKDIALQAIGYLLCTHYHPDHAGIAQEVKAQGVRLIVLEPQLGAVSFMQSYMKPDSPYVPVTLPDNLHLSITESRGFLQKLGIDGEIIHTPGHSDDSVSLVLDEGIAFTGDLTHPAIVDPATNDLVIRSWNHIRALHATRIYSGHGPQQPFVLPDF